MIPKKNIAVFASGTGSNFVSIYNQINEGVINGKIALLVSNNSDCKAVFFAKSNNIEVFIINQEIMSDCNKNENFLYKALEKEEIDLIVLAGYLKMIPTQIISYYKNKILNIHPSLLPKFGGKGFYGMKVHKAVINSKEKFTGATVHFVDEVYDNGPIILQKKIKINKSDNAESISKKVLKIEHKLLPYVVEKFCLEKIVFKNQRPIIMMEEG